MPTQKKGEQPTEQAAPAKSKATADITLPTVDFFDNVEVPEYKTSYTRKQAKGDRVFSAKGPKADAVARVIFSGQEFSRQQIADIVGCSSSRVTEVYWAIESTHADGVSWELPTLARGGKAAKVEDE